MWTDRDQRKPDRANPHPFGKMVFADLPGNFSDPGGIFQRGPIEGQEYDIKDGCKSLGPEVQQALVRLLLAAVQQPGITIECDTMGPTGGGLANG